MIEAVIFDMDGVLVDSENVYVSHVCKKLKEFDPTIKDEDVYPMVGSNMRKTREVVYAAARRALDDIEFGKCYDSIFGSFKLDYPSILKAGARETLAELYNKGYKIALASSSAEDVIDNAMRSCDLHKYFTAVISGHMFKESKPNPEIYLHTAGVLGVFPDKCLVIEDSNYGITAAKRAGMTVAAVKDYVFSIDQSQTDYFIDNLNEIPGIIKRIDRA